MKSRLTAVAMLVGGAAVAQISWSAPPPVQPGPAQNVNVINPSLKTSIDQYPRTPFAACLIAQSSCYDTFTVPSDQRLVIETVTYSVRCNPGEQGLATLALGPVRLTLVATAGPEALGSVIQNVRVVVDHDQLVYLAMGGGAGSCSFSSQQLYVAGYLVSVNSPSLAP
jgi:hypothetical protein